MAAYLSLFIEFGTRRFRRAYCLLLMVTFYRSHEVAYAHNTGRGLQLRSKSLMV